MLHESGPWKDELLKICRFFERISKKKSIWTDDDSFLVEKNIYIAFFVIRRLLEMQSKLSDYIDNLDIELLKYPAKHQKIQVGEKIINLQMDIRSRTDIDKFYDLSASPEKVKLSIDHLCNQFIHCYTYANITSTGTEFSGIFFVSDNYKNEHIYSITVQKLCEIFLIIGSDDVWSCSSQRNDDTWEMFPVFKIGHYHLDRHCMCFDLIRLIEKINNHCNGIAKNEKQTFPVSTINYIAKDAVDAATTQRFWYKSYNSAANELKKFQKNYEKKLSEMISPEVLNNFLLLNPAKYRQKQEKDRLSAWFNDEAKRLNIASLTLEYSIIIELTKILIEYLQSNTKRKGVTKEHNFRTILSYYRFWLGLKVDHR